MLGKLSYCLLLGLALNSTSVLALEQPVLPRTAGYELPAYPLTPQVTERFSSFLPIKASCKIKAEDLANVLFVKITNRSGTVNNKILKAQTGEDTLILAVHNGETLDIITEARAGVEITNQSSHTVYAVCSVL